MSRTTMGASPSMSITQIIYAVAANYGIAQPDIDGCRLTFVNGEVMAVGLPLPTPAAFASGPMKLEIPHPEGGFIEVEWGVGGVQ
ncbi:MAG: hypothetical protein SFV24_19210 [Gemmatimonadales bacterium]|nr:hypothetical protein [Gemmatimonadales bacterium]